MNSTSIFTRIVLLQYTSSYYVHYFIKYSSISEKYYNLSGLWGSNLTQLLPSHITAIYHPRKAWNSLEWSGKNQKSSVGYQSSSSLKRALGHRRRSQRLVKFINQRARLLGRRFWRGRWIIMHYRLPAYNVPVLQGTVRCCCVPKYDVIRYTRFKTHWCISHDVQSFKIG